MILEKKNIVACIILTFVTCGIYGIYWLYCMISDINTISGDSDSMSPIVVILLSIVTCGIYSVYWFYKAGALLDQKAIEFGRISENRSSLYLSLIIMGYFIPLLIMVVSESSSSCIVILSSPSRSAIKASINESENDQGCDL